MKSHVKTEELPEIKYAEFIERKKTKNKRIRTIGELLALKPDEVPLKYRKIYNKVKKEMANDIDIDDWVK